MKTQARSLVVAFILVPACGGDPSPSKLAPISAPAPAPLLSIGDATPVAVSPPVVAAPVVAPVVVAALNASAVAPTTYADALARGKALNASGDRAGARQMLEAAVKLDKHKPEPHIELARLFIAMDERGLAIAAANKAVKLDPESSQAFNTLGRAELLRFNYDGAIDAFTQAVVLNKDNVWAWNNLGLSQLALKHYDEAIAALVEATRRSTATGYMWNNLGTAYEQLDRLDDARDAFDKGGALGSREAKSSRKRLAGVKTIALARVPAPTADAAPGAASDKSGVKTYDTREDMPSDEPADGHSGAASDAVVAPDAGVPR